MSFPEWMGFRLVSLVFRESKFFLHLLRSPDVLSLVFSWNYGAKKVFDICFCTRDVRKVCFHLHLLAPCYFPSDSRIASEIYAFSLPPFRSISSSSLKILLRHPVIAWKMIARYSQLSLGPWMTSKAKWSLGSQYFFTAQRKDKEN